MLETIKITNLALISKSIVNFGDGFNVLTGETGAGKSLIVDALLFLTGARADKTLIKSGEEYARVEGIFSINLDNEVITKILENIGLENEGTLIISRTFLLNGKNECRINGELVTLNIIKKLSSHIIDIFGQNDSLELLDVKNHLKLLDSMDSDRLSPYKDNLNNLLNELNSINSNIKNLGGLDKDREKNIDFLKYQIEDIDKYQLQDNEEEDLKSKITIMENSEKIFNALNNSLEVLNGEYSIINALKNSINSLSSISEYSEDVSKDKDRLYSAKYELEDICDSLMSQKGSLTYSEYELDKLNDRLSDIKDLERKYGNTIVDILNNRNIMQEKLDILLNSDEELERLKLEKTKYLKEIYNICLELRKVRYEIIDGFRHKIITKLQKLGMKNANFDIKFLNEINLENIENTVNKDGADEVEFMFSANLGVELKSLNKIISGGEMSRFMLAFKTVQNSNLNKTCIFDEIDTGIGGEIGVVIGQEICEISKNNQVICITHLPQIASFGDCNFKIQKYDEDNKTITQVTLLDDDTKVIEIARMLGNSTNEISINHAKEIIDNSNSYKNYIKNN